MPTIVSGGRPSSEADPRAHPLERHDDAAHRPAAQRAVAGDGARGTGARRGCRTSIRMVLPELPASSVEDGRLQAADLQAEDLELDAGRAGRV